MCYVCWRGWRARVGGVLAWVTCQRGWRGWHASVGGMGGVLVSVTC